MDQKVLIKRMREHNITFKVIGSILGITAGAAKKAHKRARDIEELGERPVIKKAKFDTHVILRLKEMARSEEKLSIRDFEAELAKEFPGKAIPSKSTVQRILHNSRFKQTLS